MPTLFFKGFPRNKLFILWDGCPHPSLIKGGLEAHPTRELGTFFYLEVPKKNKPQRTQISQCIGWLCRLARHGEMRI